MNAAQIKNLTVRFGDFTAVNDVSLTLERGKVYGLLGPNGAGKTTIIRAMSTLLKPTSGSIEIYGSDVIKDPTAVRSQIGLAGQYAAVDEALTGIQNLEMVGKLYHLPSKLVKSRARETLERLGLSDAAGHKVKTYSGGMRRRLDLGASLIGHAKLMLLDEPTTGLDPRTRNELWSLIREIIGEGSTILLTTQYLEEADALADTIGIIDHGEKIAEGTSRELKNKLGNNVIRFNVDGEGHDIKKLLPDAVFDQSSREWRISTGQQGSKELMNVARTLESNGLMVEELGIYRPSLDDVFLSLTGHDTKGSDETVAKKPKEER